MKNHNPFQWGYKENLTAKESLDIEKKLASELSLYGVPSDTIIIQCNHSVASSSCKLMSNKQHNQ